MGCEYLGWTNRAQLAILEGNSKDLKMSRRLEDDGEIVI